MIKKTVITASLIISLSIIIGILFLYIDYKKWQNPRYYECTYSKIQEIDDNYSLYGKSCKPNNFACIPLASYYKINSTNDKIKTNANSKTKYDIEFVYQKKDILDDISINEIIECYFDNNCELETSNSGC